MEMEQCIKNILFSNQAIRFAYIFGSYAKGTMRKDSDVDLALFLSEDFSTEEYLDLKMQLMECSHREMDLVVLNDAPTLLKYEVSQHHVLLFARDQGEEIEFRIRTLFEYEDMKPYIDLHYQAMIQRLKEEVQKNG